MWRHLVDCRVKRSGFKPRKTWMTRGTSQLKRGGEIKRKPMKRRRSKRPAHMTDRRFTAWLHTQECCAASLSECRFSIEQHHSTEDSGMGAKSHDHESASLCGWHHQAAHKLNDCFAEFDRDRMRAWLSACIGKLRALYLATEGAGEVVCTECGGVEGHSRRCSEPVQLARVIAAEVF